LEVVGLELALGEDSVRLAGQLRSAGGDLLGEVLAEFLLQAPSGHGATRRALTDAEGGFTVAYEDFSEAATAESVFVRVIAPADSAHQGSFPLRLGPGANELGELVLSRAPLLVAGRVRDEGGAPLAGLVIEVLRRFDPSNPASGSPLSAKVVTDALGHFVLRQAAPADGGLAVRVRNRGYRWGAEAVAPGTDDLEIVVRATGQLVGHLIFDGGWAPTLWLLQEGQRVFPQAMTWSGAGRFRIDDLLPGEYDLEWSHPWALERGLVRGLRVVAGEEASDPRLEPLDLRGAWPHVRLTVVDPVGIVIPGAVLELDRGAGFERYTLKPAGELDVIAGPLPLRARVSAGGFRARELELEADATVVLTRGPLLRLVVPATLPDLPREWQWAVWVRPEESSDAARGPLALSVGENELALESAGTYRALFGAMRRHANWTEEAGGTLEYQVRIEEEGKTLTLEPFEPEFVDEVRAEIAELDPFAPR
ncbi:MAG: carboxypeptidase-like regulatory domain-containing protein, partial [Planctomycetota bacterium]